MGRLLIALALVRLLAQSAGLDLLADPCDSPCEESGGGNCSPACQDCPCCPHQRPVVLQLVLQAPAPETLELEPPGIVRPVDEPRPHEIFHIPRPGLSV